MERLKYTAKEESSENAVLSYDGLGRLSGCTLYEDGESSDGSHSENMSFDLNGNLLSLVRRSSSGDILSAYSYGYNGGNRLSGIQLSPVAPHPRARFQYDSNGNMVSDGLHGLSLDYNCLGLLSEVRSSLTDSVLVRYSYFPDGRRTGAYFGSSSAVGSSSAGIMSDGLLYIGSMTYRKSGDSYSLESVSFDGGHAVLGGSAEAGNPYSDNGSMYSVHLHVCDHLGSVRAVVDGERGEVLERNDYYPSGKRWESSSPALSSNRWRYNGKEEQCFVGVPYIDYGARMYSPDLCRWTSPDPLSEKYYSLSPYSFCGGDPVNFVDLDGQRWVDKNGNLIWENGNWTEFATQLQKDVGNVLLTTVTGRQQFNKLVDNENNITIAFDNSNVRPGLYGITKYKGHNYNLISQKYKPKGNILITIYSQNANIRAGLSDGHLTFIEALAVNLGHEIEHTTDNAIMMNVNKASYDDREREPRNVTRRLLKEFEMNKSLKEIISFSTMAHRLALASMVNNQKLYENE